MNAIGSIRRGVKVKATRAVLVTMLCACSVTDPSGSLRGRIAFTSTRDGNAEIYSMAADGSSVTRLTNHPAEDAAPTWSPDGTRIAFVSQRDGRRGLYIMNADGSDIRPVVFDALEYYPADPAWSPDGSRIAYQGSGGIMLVTAEGTPAGSLPGNGTYFPSWAPDGTSLVAASQVTIYLVPVDGSPHVAFSGHLGSSGGEVGAPAWSPDGDKIAFPFVHERSGGVALKPINGETAQIVLEADQGFTSLAWDPDSRMLAVVHDDDLFLLDPSTGRLIGLESSVTDPDWTATE